MQRIHAKGVIHRDLKPENILVGKGDDTSSIYLVDYGVSKIYLDSHGNHMYQFMWMFIVPSRRKSPLSAQPGMRR